MVDQDDDSSLSYLQRRLDIHHASIQHTLIGKFNRGIPPFKEISSNKTGVELFVSFTNLSEKS
jgi:hypothetical protein